MRDIIKEFNRYIYSYAKETVVYCQENKEKVKDILLDEVDRFIKEISEYEYDCCEASVVYSIFLLAEFRDTRLCNRIITMMNLGLGGYDQTLWDGVSNKYNRKCI